MAELGVDYVNACGPKFSENVAVELDAFLAAAEREVGKSPSLSVWYRLRKEKPALGLPAHTSIKRYMPWSEFVDPERVRNV